MCFKSFVYKEFSNCVRCVGVYEFVNEFVLTNTATLQHTDSPHTSIPTQYRSVVRAFTSPVSKESYCMQFVMSVPQVA